MCYTKKKQIACNVFLSNVWAEDSKVFIAHRSSTLLPREPRLVSVRWTGNLAAFSFRLWFIDLRRLSLTTNQKMYCSWWTSWWEATPCCFGRSCCLGPRETYHVIFTTENSRTDLCIKKTLERQLKAGSGVIPQCLMTTTGTHFVNK